MEAFNLALLARQVWRLPHFEHSLALKTLKAKYFPSKGILDAKLGNRPSYTWRSLHQPLRVVEKGSLWLVGDGWSLNIWDSKWIPRLDSFKVINPIKPKARLLRIRDLIDQESGDWNIPMINSIFLPINAEAISYVPLCSSRPRDRLAWHFSSSSE